MTSSLPRSHARRAVVVAAAVGAGAGDTIGTPLLHKILMDVVSILVDKMITMCVQTKTVILSNLFYKCIFLGILIKLCRHYTCSASLKVCAMLCAEKYAVVAAG